MTYPSQTAPCPTCGRIIHVSAQACANCGNDPKTGRPRQAAPTPLISANVLWGIGIVGFLAAFVGLSFYILWPRVPPAAPPRSLTERANEAPAALSGAQLAAAVHIGDSMQSVNSVFGSAGAIMSKGDDGNQGFMYAFRDGYVLVTADAGDRVRTVTWIRKTY